MACSSGYKAIALFKNRERAFFAHGFAKFGMIKLKKNWKEIS
ncbi:MAG: type II toxin-antitoxin system RelE/ParE family toxin [Treponema sp.]|nr:type II toxin-antitoxin system RelE/ParE family toxin [Treponema sp.]